MCLALRYCGLKTPAWKASKGGFLKQFTDYFSTYVHNHTGMNFSKQGNENWPCCVKFFEVWNCKLNNIIKTQDKKNKSFTFNKYCCHVSQMKYTGWLIQIFDLETVHF